MCLLTRPASRGWGAGVIRRTHPWPIPAGDTLPQVATCCRQSQEHGGWTLAMALAKPRPARMEFQRQVPLCLGPFPRSLWMRVTLKCPFPKSVHQGVTTGHLQYTGVRLQSFKQPPLHVGFAPLQTRHTPRSKHAPRPQQPPCPPQPTHH